MIQVSSSNPDEDPDDDGPYDVDWGDLEPDQREILRDVQEILEELADLDLELTEPADLERARRVLPNEPHRAELVSAALPRSVTNAIEYVHPSDRQDGYWRRAPDRSREAASTAQLRHRLAFTKATIKYRDEEGAVRTLDGRTIAQNAERIGSDLSGRSFREDDDGPGADGNGPGGPSDSERGGKLLSSLRDFLR